MIWAHSAIGSVCKTTTVRNPQESPEGVFRYIDIASVDREGKRIAKAESILGSDAPSRARKVVALDDVLVSTVRPNLNAVAMVTPDLDGEVASTGFCVLRAQSRVIEPRFLFFFCRAPQFIESLSNTVKGAHYPAVSDSDVKSILLPLPTPSEQRRIVELLDQADALRRLRADADAKAERILPALFVKMFGDPATNPKAWPTDTLGELAVELRYGTSQRCDDDSTGATVLRIPNVVRGEVDWTVLKYSRFPEDEMRRLRLELGDLLFVRTNGNPEYVGRCAVFEPSERDTLFASYLIRVRVDCARIDPWVLAAFVRTPSGRRAMSPYIRTTAGQSNIGAEGLRSVPVPVPPMVLQRKFREAIMAVRQQRAWCRMSSRGLEALFAIMLTRAFSGALTASWREAHMKELLQEMEQQARYLAGSPASPEARA